MNIFNKNKNTIIIDFLSDEFYELLSSLNKLVNRDKKILLFFSPEKVAKEMSIEILRENVKRKVQIINLQKSDSKYIGETEKNLTKIFNDAELSEAILFFDEADALFGKRKDSQDSNGKYSQIDKNYIFKRLESFRGIIILVMYKSENIDSIMQKIDVIIRFPYFTTLIRRLFWKVKIRKYLPASEGELKPVTESKITSRHNLC
ncbi:MAG: ATP-binding protein [Ignavibacteriaceae bacterium]